MERSNTAAESVLNLERIFQIATAYKSVKHMVKRIRALVMGGMLKRMFGYQSGGSGVMFENVW